MKGLAVLLGVVVAAGAPQGGAVRKVAVLSVIGPVGWQATMNHAEDSLVAGLRAKGLTVISLSDSRNFISANWQAAYSNLQAEKQRPSAKSGNGHLASQNTLTLSDPAQPAGRPGYSPTFCRTAGELSRQMGADAAVLMTISAGHVVQMLLIDQAGACVFRGQVRMDAKDDVTEAIKGVLRHYPK